MRVLISGAGGLVGIALQERLQQEGHQVGRLLRRGKPERALDALWNPTRQQIDPGCLERVDALIHLAGENIAARRWSTEQKQRILSSRVTGTEFLAKTLAAMANPPKVLLCASAIGYYGDRGADILTEESSPGRGFLSEVCVAWESASSSARHRGIRVAHMRFGVVLSGRGGALARMLLPFRLGFGGRIGSGAQFMSWIALSDAVDAIGFLLSGDISGPVNLVSPNPVTNAHFTRSLGKALHRPTLFPVPAFALRLGLGEMADELLLAGSRALPKRLLDAGFQFQYPDLESALHALLQA
jgi:uncharacterized protein